MSKKGRKAQFYLIAAIIIVAIVIGMAGFTTYFVKKNNTKVYDLNKELKLESESVINYGILKDEIELSNTLINFTKMYGEYIGSDYDIYFVYGNQNDMKALKYSQINTGSVSIGISVIPMKQGEVIPVPIQQAGPVKIIIEDKTYDFNLKEGENFFFVIQEQLEIA